MPPATPADAASLPHTSGEPARSQGLERYALLPTPLEPAFDHLAELAARSCGVPGAAIWLYRGDDRWFASRFGDGNRSLIACGEAPLVTPDGVTIGGISLLDHMARAPSPEVQATLARFAQLVIDQLELSRVRSQLASVEANARTHERINRLFQAVSEGSSGVGEEFFPAFAHHLAMGLGIKYVFVAACVDQARTRVRMLAFWKRSQFAPNSEYDIAGTPCERVVGGDFCHYRDDC